MSHTKTQKKKKTTILTNFESGSAIETELKSSILILSFSFSHCVLLLWLESIRLAQIISCTRRVHKYDKRRIV